MCQALLLLPSPGDCQAIAKKKIQAGIDAMPNGPAKDQAQHDLDTGERGCKAWEDLDVFIPRGVDVPSLECAPLCLVLEVLTWNMTE